MKLHTGLDYFLNLPLKEFVEILEEVNEIAERARNKN